MRRSQPPLRASSPQQILGQAAESAALQFLQNCGHTFVARNVYCRRGEIDLITLHQGWLVFTEVRWRSRLDFGGAAASVTPAKQRRIITAARYFLSHEPQWQHHFMRFDVMLYEGKPPTWQQHWIQAAFNAF